MKTTTTLVVGPPDESLGLYQMLLPALMGPHSEYCLHDEVIPEKMHSVIRIRMENGQLSIKSLIGKVP